MTETTRYPTDGADATRPIPTVPAWLREPGRHRHRTATDVADAAEATGATGAAGGVPRPREATHSGGVPALRRHAAPAESPAIRTGGHQAASSARHAASPERPATRTGEHAVRHPGGEPAARTGEHAVRHPGREHAARTGEHAAHRPDTEPGSGDRTARRSGSEPASRRGGRTARRSDAGPAAGERATRRHAIDPDRAANRTGEHTSARGADTPTSRTGEHTSTRGADAAASHAGTSRRRHALGTDRTANRTGEHTAARGRDTAAPASRTGEHTARRSTAERGSRSGTSSRRHALDAERSASGTRERPDAPSRSTEPEPPATPAGELPGAPPSGRPPRSAIARAGGSPVSTGEHPLTAVERPTATRPADRPARTGEYRVGAEGPSFPDGPTASGAMPARTAVPPPREPFDDPSHRTGGHPVHMGSHTLDLPTERLHGPATHTGSYPAAPPHGPVTRTGSYPATPPNRLDGPATHTGGHRLDSPPNHTGGHRLHGPPTHTGSYPAAPPHGPITRTGSYPAAPPHGPITRTGSYPATPPNRLDGPATHTGGHRLRPDGPTAPPTDRRPRVQEVREVDPDVPTPAHGVEQVDEPDPLPASGVPTCGCEPTLTASFRPDGTAASLTEHREIHGEQPRMRRGELTDLVEAALVRGRGGAGFPLVGKLKAAAGARKSPEIMVNGAESEPASVKDRMLLGRAPHLVLDGAQLLADEIGARGITVWVHDFAAADTLGKAIGERNDPVPVTVVRAPDGYLAGESSAALAHLGGRPALPAFTLRPAAEQGPYGRPVVVSNAESVAAVAALAIHGLERHRSFGTADEPGTRLLTVHRGPGEPVLVEAATGVAVLDALRAAGAPTDVAAVLVGGYFGRWLEASTGLAAPLSHAGLDAVGGTLGAGLVIAPEHGSCLLGEVAEVVDHLASQNAGQCGPCVNGLPALARTIDAIVAGDASEAELRRVHELAATVAGRGACKHPDGVTMFAVSAVDVLAAEVAAHLGDGCGSPQRGWLPLPERSEVEK